MARPWHVWSATASSPEHRILATAAALWSRCPLGRALEPALVEAARSINALATAGLGEEESTQFMRLLATAIANLESIDADPRTTDEHRT